MAPGGEGRCFYRLDFFLMWGGNSDNVEQMWNRARTTATTMISTMRMVTVDRKHWKTQNGGRRLEACSAVPAGVGTVPPPTPRPCGLFSLLRTQPRVGCGAAFFHRAFSCMSCRMLAPRCSRSHQLELHFMSCIFWAPGRP